jgi:hypothetical protein
MMVAAGGNLRRNRKGMTRETAMWYGDTIWPTLIVLGTVAALAAMMWRERRRTVFLVVALLCIPAAVAAIAVERSILTPREQVMNRLEKMISDFEARNTDAVVEAISDRAPELQTLASNALSKVAIDNVRLTDVNVELSGEDVLRARTHFRVNADVIFSGVTRLGRQPTRWKATWEQEADSQWRLLDLEQLDPLTGEVTHQARQYVN